MENQTTAKWHQLRTEEATQLLGVDLQTGLSAVEVKRRQAKFGPNKISARRRASAFWLFLLQFAQPLVYILLAAAVVTAVLGHYVDASVILGVVLMNAGIGFVQESKAEKAIDALAAMVTTETTVLRDGQRRRVNSIELVTGDVVLLTSGDKVPADLRLFRVHELRIDESALTGESLAIGKHPAPLALDTVLAERRNLAFAGTLVTSGQGEGLVWATGNATETGRIAQLVEEAVDLSTPLARKIAQFSRLLLWVILGLAAITFAIGVHRGNHPFDMFMGAVAIAVGAIPEGLPAAVTITLAIGVARMAKRRAIIRKLPAVEALGSTTVICSDKTGTLTENQMTVQQIYAGGIFYDVTGSGYEARGEVRRNGARIVLREHPALGETLLAGLLNNDAQLVRAAGRRQAEGDPTEAALIVAAEKAGLQPAEIHSAHPRLDVIPFESKHQFMATLHSRGAGAARVIYKKGSAERLLERCAHSLGQDGERAAFDRAAVRAALEEMAGRGLRVLAFARREVASDHGALEHKHVRTGLTFLGLQGMIDPPRAEAIAAVRHCLQAGMQVKMITGDHALTARRIAQQLGLRGGPEKDLISVTGRELDQVSDADLPELAERAAVFARVAPEQKLRLVRALQARGHIVAMTGDGVNDAPALKQADIGVAMGLSGTDVAKGAADMILTDDNFASIEAAVEEGRGVFDNLTKFILWTVPTNAGEGLLLLVAIFLGTALPALPVQVLWINMSTAVLLGLMLVFEPKEHDLMHRPPRDPRQPIFTFPLLMRTGLVCLLTLLGGFGLFLWMQQQHPEAVAEARTAVVNVVVIVQIFYLLNCRSLTHSMFYVGLWSNPSIIFGIVTMLAAQMLFTYAPFMNRLFHSAPLAPGHWIPIVGTGLLVHLLVGFEKWVRFGRIPRPSVNSHAREIVSA